MGIDLNKLAQFWLAREHARGPDAAAEQAAEAAGTEQLVKKAQLARALQELKFGPADRALRTRLTEAQIRNYDEPNRNPTAATVHYERDARGNVTAIIPQPDGTFKKVPMGAVGMPQRPSGSGGGADGGFAANPFNVTDSQGRIRLAVRVRGGGLQFVDKIGDEQVGPGPTADMRNNDQQSQAVEPAFELVQNSLNNLKRESSGIGGSISGMVPGTKAYFAKTHFQDQAKALLGAIVARQSGEGSRLSDEDRKAYSRASTIVDNLILLPGGVEEAELRLREARALIDEVVQRRRLAGGGMAPMTSHASPDATAGNKRIKFDAQGNVIQ